MTYYIIVGNEKKENLINSTNILGEDSMGTFYTDDGFIRLKRILNDFPELVKTIQIFDNKNNYYTIEEFINQISKYKLIL